MGVSIYPIQSSPPREVLDPRFKSQFSSWRNASLDLHQHGTHFGYVHSGNASLVSPIGKFELQPGMYFSVPGEATIQCSAGIGFVATRMNYDGFFQVGGPIEERGRLTYIDGCSDSLLISPVVEGDPCLNLLYLPPHTTQSEHVHPSCRVGMVTSGSGVCRTPDAEIPLQPGVAFEIAPDALHSFHTSDESMRVIAWHPDSDFGPTHRNHPMINRTIIDGESAANRNARPASIRSVRPMSQQPSKG